MNNEGNKPDININLKEFKRCAICSDSLEILRTGCVAPHQLILKVALSTK